MPSRQERRKAERDAANRAPGQAGAAGAAAALADLNVNVDPAGAGAVGEAAAALANVHVTPLGDWQTQAEHPYVGPGGYCLPRHDVL
jgi:hypothetical protein